MIYLVTNNKELFNNEYYKIISVEESLRLLNTFNMIQYDSETKGRDPHIGTLLLIQFGNKNLDIQIVVDVTTIDVTYYKYYLETKFIIGHNLKFDLQWLYNYNIVPRKVYDTMIVEQFLYLGYPPYNENSEFSGPSMSLKAVAERRLGVHIDKTIRGQIIWRGIDTETIKYAAGDVVYLEDIMYSQIKDCKEKNCLIGAKIECDFTPVVAYLEWCGIKLDKEKWQYKMQRDSINLENCRTSLDKFVINLAKTDPKFKKYVEDPSMSLFGDSLGIMCFINWDSSNQVIPLAKDLGFNTTIKDKNTGEDKDTVLEKELTRQKGINDEFLHLMFGWDEKTADGKEIHHWGYKECSKLCTTYGQGHLNAINPNTGRLHTVYKAIGTTSGRMSSGSKQNNNDLAALKGLPINPNTKQKKEGKGCPYPNMQQLPHDAFTRSCFIAEKGNLICSCDYAAMEARIGADVYNEQMLLEEFLHRSGDTHAAYAKVVFADELKDIEIKDIKKKRPDLRSKVKAVEFKVKYL